MNIGLYQRGLTESFTVCLQLVLVLDVPAPLNENLTKIFRELDRVLSNPSSSCLRCMNVTLKFIERAQHEVDLSSVSNSFATLSR